MMEHDPVGQTWSGNWANAGKFGPPTPISRSPAGEECSMQPGDTIPMMNFAN